VCNWVSKLFLFTFGAKKNPSKRELVIQCPDNISDFAAFEEDLDFVLHRLNWKGKTKLGHMRVNGRAENHWGGNEWIEFMRSRSYNIDQYDIQCWFYTPSLVDTFYTESGIYM